MVNRVTEHTDLDLANEGDVNIIEDDISGVEGFKRSDETVRVT